MLQYIIIIIIIACNQGCDTVMPNILWKSWWDFILEMFTVQSNKKETSGGGNSKMCYSCSILEAVTKPQTENISFYGSHVAASRNVNSAENWSY